jgi:hypothetical protein
VPTINARKHQRWTPWEAVPELEVRKRPSSTLENVDDGPLARRCRSWRSRSAHHQRWKTSTVDPLGGGARARGPGVPTINARKRQRQDPWEAVPELEIRKHPPSTLENIDGRPPRRRCQSWRSGSAHHQRCKNVPDRPPWEAVPVLEVQDPQGVL